MDKIEIIKQFVRENTFVKEANINENTLIFKEGYIDSMGFLSLLSFIEEQFNITPIDSELIETNFESINVIADFIEKRESKAAIRASLMSEISGRYLLSNTNKITTNGY